MFKKILILLLIPAFTFAQKVDKKTGDINYNGEVIGKVEKSGGILKTFTLYDASNEEVAAFEPNGESGDDFAYEVFFAQTDNKGECPGNVGFANKIAKAFVKSKLIDNGNYNSNKEARFMSALMGEYYGGNVVSKPRRTERVRNEENELLERDRDGMIQVFGNSVKQDFKDIASIKKSQKATDGTIVYRIKVFNHLGKQIAEASGRGINAKNYSVTTFKDNRNHNVRISNNISEVKDIIEMLVDKYYL